MTIINATVRLWVSFEKRKYITTTGNVMFLRRLMLMTETCSTSPGYYICYSNYYNKTINLSSMIWIRILNLFHLNRKTHTIAIQENKRNIIKLHTLCKKQNIRMMKVLVIMLFGEIAISIKNKIYEKPAGKKYNLSGDIRT